MSQMVVGGSLASGLLGFPACLASGADLKSRSLRIFLAVHLGERTADLYADVYGLLLMRHLRFEKELCRVAGHGDGNNHSVKRHVRVRLVLSQGLLQLVLEE